MCLEAFQGDQISLQIVCFKHFYSNSSSKINWYIGREEKREKMCARGKQLLHQQATLCVCQGIPFNLYENEIGDKSTRQFKLAAVQMLIL